MAVTKDDIVARIHEDGFSKKQAVDLVEALIEIMKATLEKGDDILISGFGKFCVKRKNQRRGRNPATGEDLMLRERRVITFKCSGKLRNKINARPAISRLTPQSAVSPSTPYPVGFDLAEQGRVADLQQSRGLGSVAAGFLQGLCDQSFFNGSLGLLQR